MNSKQINYLIVFIISLFITCAACADKPVDYEPTWNSLSGYNVPEWFKDAKFGIYTHWGPYSVPGCGPNGCWYPHNMYREGTEQYEYHVKHYGGPEKFGYKDFIPMFTAEKFDADEWAELFKKAGAKFAGPVAEHHDGFAMWDSKYSEWDAMDKGPKRDIVGELEKAVKKRGMRYITTFHNMFNWEYYPVWDKRFDCSDPQYSDLYGQIHERRARRSIAFFDEWSWKVKEVIDKYEPDVIWFDWDLRDIREDYVQDFLAYYYNSAEKLGKEVVVLPKGRSHSVPPVTAVPDLEVERMSALTFHVWITDSGVGDPVTWSWVRNQPFKSVNRLVDNLVDRVSKNGLLLLNIGPKPDGSMPEGGKECLLGIGKWLQVNGEAIYGTRPWKYSGGGPDESAEEEIYGEGDEEPGYGAEDIRLTVKDDAMYAISLGWPGEECTIKILNWMYKEEFKSIKMLGVDGELEWSFNRKDGLTIKAPDKKPCEHAFVFKITRNFNVNQPK